MQIESMYIYTQNVLQHRAYQVGLYSDNNKNIIGNMGSSVYLEVSSQGLNIHVIVRDFKLGRAMVSWWKRWLHFEGVL